MGHISRQVLVGPCIDPQRLLEQSGLESRGGIKVADRIIQIYHFKQCKGSNFAIPLQLRGRAIIQLSTELMFVIIIPTAEE